MLTRFLAGFYGCAFLLTRNAFSMPMMWFKRKDLPLLLAPTIEIVAIGFTWVLHSVLNLLERTNYPLLMSRSMNGTTLP